MFFQPADTVKYTVTALLSLGGVQLIEAHAPSPPRQTHQRIPLEGKDHQPWHSAAKRIGLIDTRYE